MIATTRPVAFCLAVLGMLALIPAAVAAAEGRGAAGAFIATTIACIFLAGAIVFTTGGLKVRLRSAQALAVLTAVWFVVPIAATPALAKASGLPPLAAWLEAVSAFTTTGVTALKNGPKSLYVWLALLQWTGGLLTVVGALGILAPAGLGGLPDRTARGGMSLDVIDIREIIKDVLPIYGGFTALLVLLLMVTGHSFLVAFSIATAVASAGAHLPPEAQVALTTDATTKWVLIPALLWSATSVRWHRSVLTLRLRGAPEGKESGTILVYWAVLGVVLGAVLAQGLGLPWAVALRDGLFTGASLIATSGMGPPEGTYQHLPTGVVVVAALLGGGALSVAGGLKIFRLRAIILRTQGDLLRLLYPNLVQPAALGESGMGSAMRGIWVGAAALFTMFALVLVALSAGLPSLNAAFAAAVAVLSNCGPIYDLAGEKWPALASLPAGSVIAAGIGMVAGRLEVIGLMVVVHLAFWRT